MFFPKAMTEIELIVPAKDLMAVTKVLSGHGSFHQVDSNYSYPGSDADSANIWQERAALYASLERRLQVVMQTLGVEEGTPPPSQQFESMSEVDKIRSDVERLEEEVRGITERLHSERKRLEQLENNLHQLKPLEGLDLDISQLRESRYLYSMLGYLPTANVERLQTSLARVPHVFLPLKQDAQKPVVWLASTKSNADVLERAARSAYLNPLSLPAGFQGTPSQIIESICREMEEANGKITELKEALGKLAAARKQELQKLLWEAHASRALADAIVRFGKLRYTYVIVGWVPTDSLEALTERLKNASKEILIEAMPIKRSGVNERVPVALSDSKLLRPFQMLVNTYARPRYGELDPTILIAITFPLLFGAMFGDIGQGLVLAILGYLMATKRLLPKMSSLGGIITACGLSAAFFGVLYGSIFGFEEEFLGVKFHALWMSPLHNIMDILMITVGAGAVLLIIGFLAGIFNYAMARNWGHLFFGHNGVAGFLLYLSLLGLGGALAGFLPVPLPPVVVVAAISGVAILFSEVFIHLIDGHRPLIVGGIGIYAIQAVVELFEVVISFLSNTLSYVRVGAFAVAHGGLSTAIFILAELVGGGGRGLGYWIVVVLGNVFITGFEGLIVGIQTMRLSYYEFFSKFFTGGGLRFEPLILTPVREE